jgi:hypothetical protein
MDEVERAILELLAGNPSPPPTAGRIAQRLAQPVDEVDDALAALRVLHYVSARPAAPRGGAAGPTYTITPAGRAALAEPCDT